MTLPPLRSRNRPRPLVAAAARIGDTEETAFDLRQKMDWQTRALEYLNLIPELDYSSRFYARMLKQLRIFPAELDEQNKAVEVTTGPPVDLLNRIQDPSGGRSQILGSYGRLMFSTGEGVLFGRELNTEKEKWSFVWVDELEIETIGSGEATKLKSVTWKPTTQSEGKKYTAEQASIYRLWTPHPRRTGEPTSPMRAAVEGKICEELIILTASVLSTATSRMVKGMLLLPSDLSFAPEDTTGDEDPENNIWLSRLIDSAQAQVENPGSAAAAMPTIIEGAYDYLDQIRMVQVHDPQNDYMEQSLRKEAIERLARGFDFPPEVLLGLSEANHWAARQILDDMWRSHGAPIAEQFCDDLNDVYLRPALKDADFPDWQKIVIGYDESQVVVKPDRAEDAHRAYQAGVLSEKAYRSALNFSDDDAPSEKEKERYVFLKTRGLQIGQQPRPSQARPDVEQGPPPPGPEGDSGRRTRAVASANGHAHLAEELGAAQFAVQRCRELAGIRLKQRDLSNELRKICGDCLDNAKGQPDHMIPVFIGPEVVEKLGTADPLSLVKGGASSFIPYLMGRGYSRSQAEALTEMVEVYAARTIFEPKLPALPGGFASQLERARTKELAE
jgi:hypothetical protein